jgi:undecaprenyl diphosphate synthase
MIMDGNGRWAKSRGLLRNNGHRAGADAVLNCVEACQELDVEFLTLYAFSTENWRRPKLEVQGLMKLLEKFLVDKTPTLMKKNVRLEAIGRLDMLPDSARRKLDASIAQTSGNTSLTVVLALSYGSREEIVDGVRGLMQAAADGKLKPEQLDAELFAQHLYTKAYPDPDLLVRTSGEMRISNFLLWQISYAEIVIQQHLWPDTSHQHVYDAVAEYQQRSRRFGGL